MATYKVIQDIEAEDHILGPFTFRQFMYLLVAIFFAYLTFLALTKRVYFLLLMFLPPTAFFSFIAFPFIKDQPTEIWAIAKISFLIRPRKRIWDQFGIKNLVEITVPKKDNKNIVKDLNQTEIRNRLRRLSETIDSRGWAIKNIDYNPQVIDVYGTNSNTERLIDPSSQMLIQPTESTPEEEYDLFDPSTSQTASQIENVVNQKTSEHKNYLINMVRGETVDDSSINKMDDQQYDELLRKNEAKKLATSNLRKVGSKPGQPLPKQIEENTHKQQPKQINNAIINLASNNNLSIQTLAKEINKNDDSKEVVISLR